MVRDAGVALAIASVAPVIAGLRPAPHHDGRRFNNLGVILRCSRALAREPRRMAACAAVACGGATSPFEARATSVARAPQGDVASVGPESMQRGARLRPVNKPQRHPEEPPKARDRKGDAGVSKDGDLLLYRFSYPRAYAHGGQLTPGASCAYRPGGCTSAGWRHGLSRAARPPPGPWRGTDAPSGAVFTHLPVTPATIWNTVNRSCGRFPKVQYLTRRRSDRI
jgi:hypothetical protein